jgi:integrase
MASGTVYRRTTPAGASSWVAHITWQEGSKRRQAKKSFDTKKDAQSALTTMLASHQSGTFAAPSRRTVADLVEPWLDGLAIQGRKPTTLFGYRRIMRLQILPTLGPVPVQDIRATDLDALYAMLLRRGGVGGKPLSLTSVHHVHAVMSKFLHDAERKGLVARNVAPLANAPSLTTARSEGPEMRVWTPEQLAKFLTAIAGNRNEALFRVMALTGLRRSEAAGLRWSDLDLAHKRLTVNQAATVVGPDEVLGPPKSKRSRRRLALDDETVTILRKHKVERTETYLRLGVTATAGDRVFADDLGGPLRPDSIGRAFDRLVAKHGLPEIRLHDLRHTHASHLLAADVNVKIVSDRLGHASVSFTLDTYAHVMPGQQADAAEAAAALLREA